MNLTQRLLLALLVLVALTTAAWAENKNGMYWTSRAAADDIQVRRLEDTTHGVVCYVASNSSRLNPDPAISCIKAARLP